MILSLPTSQRKAQIGTALDLGRHFWAGQNFLSCSTGSAFGSDISVRRLEGFVIALASIESHTYCVTQLTTNQISQTMDNAGRNSNSHLSNDAAPPPPDKSTEVQQFWHLPYLMGLAMNLYLRGGTTAGLHTDRFLSAIIVDHLLTLARARGVS